MQDVDTKNNGDKKICHDAPEKKMNFPTLAKELKGRERQKREGER